MKSVTGKYWIRGIGSPPSFKNKRFIRVVRGRAVSFTDPKKKKWMLLATKQLEAQRISEGYERATKAPSRKRNEDPCKYAHHIHVVIFARNYRLADPSGALETIMDCLVSAGILADDSPRYVATAHVGWVIGKTDEIEIEIEKV